MAQTLIENIFDKKYPNITLWVTEYGWIELGQDSYSHSFVRALDEGGVIWEGRHSYMTMDEVFHELDEALARWIEDNYG